MRTIRIQIGRNHWDFKKMQEKLGKAMTLEINFKCIGKMTLTLMSFKQHSCTVENIWKIDKAHEIGLSFQ